MPISQLDNYIILNLSTGIFDYYAYSLNPFIGSIPYKTMNIIGIVGELSLIKSSKL